MATRVQYNAVFDNSGVLTLPPAPILVNLAEPNLSKPDSLQAYDIGTRYEYNGKVYFYGRAAGSINPSMGAKIKNPQDTQQRVVAAAALYATQLVVTTVSPDGPTYDGKFPVNYLKGGHCVVFPATGGAYYFTRGIVGNTALVAAGAMTITLDAPTPSLMAAAGGIECIASPWAAMVPSTDTKISCELSSCCGVPTCIATNGQWLWVQTWGPCWISPDPSCGAGTDNRQAYFGGDGAVADGDLSGVTSVCSQFAGWVMANDYAGGQAAPILYLQIAR